MHSFFRRFISAIIAVALIFVAYHIYSIQSLRILCFLVVVIGTAELIKILFKPEDSFTIKALFYISMTSIFILSVKYIELASLIFSIASIIYFSLSLLLQKKFEDLHSLSLFQAKSILGFFYLGLLPAFACKILDLQNGLQWFLSLLIIVFSGDTFAYVFGLLWGRKKIMPSISPKKTYLGSIGGLLGSILSAIMISEFLLLPTKYVALMGLVVGIVGQFGDLFESMLKRVADIKDSGSIMPGHGGVLDRIDGVLFAAPFVYLFAYLIERLAL